MSFRLRRVDTQLLMDIAEYRLMTIEQVAVLQARSKQSIWRRLRDLEKQGFLQTQLREWGRKRGRPEVVVMLSPQGWELLNKSTPSIVVNDDVLANNVSCQDHQLLLNWFRQHINMASDTLPQLNVRFPAHSSPLLPSSLTEQMEANDETIIAYGKWRAPSALRLSIARKNPCVSLLQTKTKSYFPKKRPTPFRA